MSKRESRWPFSVAPNSCFGTKLRGENDLLPPNPPRHQTGLLGTLGVPRVSGRDRWAANCQGRWSAPVLGVPEIEMRVFVAGGTGAIGRHAVRALVGEGHA